MMNKWENSNVAAAIANKAFDAACKALHEQVTYLEDMREIWTSSLADAINNNLHDTCDYKMLASKALVAMGLKPLNTED